MTPKAHYDSETSNFANRMLWNFIECLQQILDSHGIKPGGHPARRVAACQLRLPTVMYLVV
jgi:hypothetical protein